MGSRGGTGRGARLLTEGDVEDEEGEGVAVLRRPGAPEVRHRRRRWRSGTEVGGDRRGVLVRVCMGFGNWDGVNCQMASARGPRKIDFAK